MAAHLQTAHKDKLSGKPLSTLLSWSAVQTMGIKTCPFCSDHGPEDTPDLVDHVLQEAYEFALRALPWPKPIDHDLNELPGGFTLPDEGDDENSVSRWIKEPAPQDQNVVDQELCPYDTADHSEPLNLVEYTNYFDEGGYFDDKHEVKSSAAKTRSSEAEFGSFWESDVFDEGDYPDVNDYLDRKHKNSYSGLPSEAEPGDTSERTAYTTGLHILYDSMPDSQHSEVDEIEYVLSDLSIIPR